MVIEGRHRLMRERMHWLMSDLGSKAGEGIRGCRVSNLAAEATGPLP